MCVSLSTFIGPAFLAYYDEANRNDTDITIKTKLYKLSRDLNKTYIDAKKLVSQTETLII